MATVTRVLLALLRGFCVLIVLAMPAAMLPEVSPDAVALLMVLALCAALFTFADYAPPSPVLSSFRAAPPINRLRICALAAILALLATLVGGEGAPGLASEIAQLLARWLDFPLSPLRLIDAVVPLQGGDAAAALLRQAAALSYAAALASIVAFLLILRLLNWPDRKVAAHLWAVLPCTAPFLPSHSAAALRVRARLNIVLGLLLPFLLLLLLKAWGLAFGEIALGSPLLLVWTLSLWSFIPASIVMRGAALARLARVRPRQAAPPVQPTTSMNAAAHRAAPKVPEAEMAAAA